MPLWLRKRLWTKFILRVLNQCFKVKELSRVESDGNDSSNTVKCTYTDVGAFSMKRVVSIGDAFKKAVLPVADR